jgi:hypothetical protein
MRARSGFAATTGGPRGGRSFSERFSAVVAAEELSLISYERSEREMYVGGIVGVLLIVLLVILILRLA